MTIGFKRRRGKRNKWPVVSDYLARSIVFSYPDETLMVIGKERFDFISALGEPVKPEKSAS